MNMEQIEILGSMDYVKFGKRPIDRAKSLTRIHSLVNFKCFIFIKNIFIYLLLFFCVSFSIIHIMYSVKIVRSHHYYLSWFLSSHLELSVTFSWNMRKKKNFTSSKFVLSLISCVCNNSVLKEVFLFFFPRKIGCYCFNCHIKILTI